MFRQVFVSVKDRRIKHEQCRAEGTLSWYARGFWLPQDNFPEDHEWLVTYNQRICLPRNTLPYRILNCTGCTRFDSCIADQPYCVIDGQIFFKVIANNVSFVITVFRPRESASSFWFTWSRCVLERYEVQDSTVYPDLQCKSTKDNPVNNLTI